MQQSLSEEEEQTVTEETGNSKRVRRQPERYGYTYFCKTSSPETTNDPISVREALESPDRESWIEAMKDELQAFKYNDAWVQVSFSAMQVGAQKESQY